LEQKLKAALRAAQPPARAVIIDCESMNMIDSTAMERLAALHAELASRHVALGFARVRDPVLDAMRRDGLVELFGSENFFPSIGDAVADFSSRLEES
jgi:MFS superfamily sulfate permease-like transporter